MFLREKKSGSRSYLQVVENFRDGGKPRQRVVATLGRLDQLRASGALDQLLASGARLSESAVVLQAHKRGECSSVRCQRFGSPVVFERLWEQTGCGPVLRNILASRAFQFPVERAVLLTVLHRLVDPGSDRAADQWKNDYQLDGVDELSLHHLYRAMAWLGEPLAHDQQHGSTAFSPRCTKDLIEEALFERRRDLFSSMALVLFDTTSLYFEGNGGQSLGARGNSKDHRPDLNQMVVGLVLDGQGRPVCCELWPGNTTDVKSLVPIVDRLRTCFGIQRVCVVADRGMISKSTMGQLDHPERGWLYILGARMRSVKQVRLDVLSRAGRYRVVNGPRHSSDDPSPLKVKEVLVDEHRYIVCYNEEQARKDAADREAILDKLRTTMKQASGSLVGNKGFRKYLTAGSDAFKIDEAKVRREARYDGKWVLRTTTNWSAEQVALTYKQLWRVEEMFRTAKSLLRTRPIFHKCDETIRGHVFCSFLALLLRDELQRRLQDAGHGNLEWKDIIRDLEHLTNTEVLQQGKRFVLRSDVRGTAGKVCRAVGVALPPTVRQLEDKPDL